MLGPLVAAGQHELVAQLLNALPVDARLAAMGPVLSELVAACAQPNTEESAAALAPLLLAHPGVAPLLAASDSNCTSLLLAAARADAAGFAAWVKGFLQPAAGNDGSCEADRASTLLAPSAGGQSLLHWAAEQGASDVASAVLGAALSGAPSGSASAAARVASALVATDAAGDSPLWIAAATGSAPMLAQLLLALHASTGGDSQALLAAVLAPGRSLFGAAAAASAAPNEYTRPQALPVILQVLVAFMQGDLASVAAAAASVPFSHAAACPRLAAPAAYLASACGPAGLTPLHIAALAGDAGLTAALCELGGAALQPAELLTIAQSNDTCKDFLPPLPVSFAAPLSPLHLAVAARQPRVLEVLCAAAAGAAAPAAATTPAPPLLHWAAAVAPSLSPHADLDAHARATACVGVLLAHGAEAAQLDPLGWSATAIALFRNAPPALVTALSGASAQQQASPPPWLDAQRSVPPTACPAPEPLPACASSAPQWECHLGLGTQATGSGTRAFPALALPLPSSSASERDAATLVPARLVVTAVPAAGSAGTEVALGSATVWLRRSGGLLVPAGADDAVVAAAAPEACACAPSTTGAPEEAWPAYLPPGPRDWFATAALHPQSFALRVALQLPPDVAAAFCVTPPLPGRSLQLARVRRLACAGGRGVSLVPAGTAAASSASMAAGQLDSSAFAPCDPSGGSGGSTFFPGLVDLPASHTATVRAATALRPSGVVAVVAGDRIVGHLGLRLQFFSQREALNAGAGVDTVAATTTLVSGTSAAAPASVMAVRLTHAASSGAPASAAPLTSPAACRVSWTKPRVFGHRGSGADNAAAVVVGTPPGMPPPPDSPAAAAVAAASRPAIMHVRAGGAPAAPGASAPAGARPRLSLQPLALPPAAALSGACAMASGPALGDGTEVGAALFSPTAGRRRRTHVAENTLLSFAAAGRAGAAFIEFDVQLTRDAVPVIHHDWGVKLPGPARIRMPLTHLTAEQFLSLRPQPMTNEAASDELEIARAADGAAALRGPLPSSAPGRDDGGGAGWGPQPTPAYASTCGIASAGSALQWKDNRRRVDALGLEPGSGSAPPPVLSAPAGGSPPPAPSASTMAVTFTSPGGPHPPSGGDPVLPPARLAVDFQLGLRDRFCTLEEVLRGRGGIPAALGYNIEVKYPTADETATFGLKPLERNAYIDRILDVIDASAGGRPIMFSSFDPDTCVCLARKQRRYPVFLLTEALPSPLYADPRWNSLAAAVAFARGVGLFGVVTDVRPLLPVPGVLIPRIQRGSGLVLVTYGRRNNDPAVVRAQMAAGIGAVIVDHVTHICKSLKEQGP